MDFNFNFSVQVLWIVFAKKIIVIFKSIYSLFFHVTVCSVLINSDMFYTIKFIENSNVP